MKRSALLQSFVDAATEAFTGIATQEASRQAIARVFAALRTAAEPSSAAAARLSACAHLPRALAVEPARVEQQRLMDCFAALEPSLRWRPKHPYDHATASSNFPDGHANAMILGPSGLEERRDVWLGVSLMAPHVRYPDHNHDPEEVYLVLSDGEFRQGDSDWFTPGIGGTLYNRPRIMHAMRSTATPLFAFWALPVAPLA